MKGVVAAMSAIKTDTLIIINPAAGNGAAGRKRLAIDALAAKFFSEHQTLVTDGPGRAGEYASQALAAGVGTVICVGGDGTLNEVVNGLMAGAVEKMRRPQLGYLPCGTGSDLARTVGVSDNLENGLRDIAKRGGKWVDVGRASFVGPEGERASRYFINVLSFALGGEVAGRVNRAGKGMGGFLSFLWATMTAIFVFEKPLISLEIDDSVARQIICWHVAFANGQYHGGGMRIAPDAKVDDGRLRVTVVGDLTLLEVLRNLPNLYNGKIYSVGKVARFSGSKIAAASRTRVLIDLDGEQVGCLPVKAEILPRALWLIC